MHNLPIVEAILDRKVFSGKVLYYTKWKDSNDKTWQSVKLLQNYRHLIKQFNLYKRNRYYNNQQDEEMEQPITDYKIENQQKPEALQQDFYKNYQRNLPSSIPYSEAYPPYPPQKKKKQVSNQKEVKVPKRRGRPPKNQSKKLQQLKTILTEKSPLSSIQVAYKRKDMLIKRQQPKLPPELSEQKILFQQKKKDQQLYFSQQDTKEDDLKFTKGKNQCKKDAEKKGQSKQLTEARSQQNQLLDGKNQPEQAKHQQNQFTAGKNQQQKMTIYGLEFINGSSLYTVKQTETTFKKYSTSEMLKLYPGQLVHFLEQSIVELSKTTDNSIR